MLPFHLFPIRRNRILFLSLEGGSRWEYSCNPRYLCEYILTLPETDRPEMVWLFRDPKAYAFLAEFGIRLASHFSLRGFYYCMTSRIIITNGGYLTWFPFRSDQIRINTWHGGGAYKRLENDREGANPATLRRMEFCARNTQAFVSSSGAFSEYAIRNAFRYSGEILPIGMPRNDVLFGASREEAQTQVHQHFHIPKDSRILLYAPTFRPFSSDSAALDPARALEILRESTHENWVMMIRSHTKSSASPAFISGEAHVLDVSDFEDTQQLLCAADLLITDYSSIVWDYCLTDGPVILFTPDLQEYRKHQGFYIDICDWGFPLCESTEALAEALRNISYDPEKNGCLKHRVLLNSYETGEACKKLWNYIHPYLR